ncbi:MAG: Dabb family protein [Thomasclavelia sp.]
MIRHISIFTLKDKQKINDFMDLLNEISDKCPLIINFEIGKHVNKNEPVNDYGPHFGDVIQLIDFKNQLDADAYPQSKEHIYLIENGPLMEEVTAIDYEI